MKKIVYKSIFSIVIVLFAFLMLPNKQVKAQEQQGYPTYLLKVPVYQYYYEKANSSTHEYLAQYVLDGIVIDTINDYFFIIKQYTAMNKGYNNGINSYELEHIETGSDFTLFYVRFTFTTYFLNTNYGGYEHQYVWSLFTENSAFYVAYDVYSWGYGNGFRDGRDYGRGIGYLEGRVEGWSEGYYKGYDDGHKEGYDEGYQIGFEEGDLYGYDIGYDRGYNKGYNKGYNEGIEQSYDVGYNDGYQEGISTNYDYMQGYNDGFKDGEKSKIAQNNEAFYKSIEKWLVPAIITVIVLGGIVSIIAIKRREQ